jgi:DNA-binding response OmpR family regulator
MNALVIDHSPAVSQRIALVLQRIGLDVKQVSTRAEALTIAANRAFDVVVLDLQLPEGGAQTCAALAGFVPIDRFIILTRLARSRRDRDFLMGFAGRVLVRPFCNENMREAVLRTVFPSRGRKETSCPLDPSALASAHGSDQRSR